MRYSHVSLESFGSAIPETVLTSAEIETHLESAYTKLGIPKGKLQELTGISERRVWPVGTLPSTVATEAAKQAMEEGKLGSEDIDLVIHTGVCRDSLEPSTANVVHANLGLKPECIAFDVSNACVGFLNGMLVAANMIELGQVKRALVVTGENAGPIYQDTIDRLKKHPDLENFQSSLASLTLGSAAVAVVLTHQDVSTTSHRLLGGVCHADSKSHDLCRGEGNPNHQSMRTNTRELLRKGLTLAHVSWQYFTRVLDWGNNTPNHILTHQISRSHSVKFFEMLGLDPEKGSSHIEHHGNTGSAAAPMLMIDQFRKGNFHPGEYIALLGIGSGINTVMLGVQW